MVKNLLILFLFIVQISAYAQRQVRVVDSISNKGIPYVAIRFGINNGVYTDDKGEFSIDDITSDSIILSSIGYEKKSVNLKSLKEDIIYLNPSNLELEEVFLSSKKEKHKTKKIKPKKHNDFRLSHRLIIGSEMAILIPNNFNSHDVELKSLIIPIVTRTISFDKSMNGKAQRIKRLPFSAMYKITFYENFGGMPAKQLNHEAITIVLDEKSTTVTLDIEKYNISLPSEGVFVGILNLGKTDENGNLISTSPFELKKNKDGKMIKFIKPTKPYFPVHFEEKIHHTYSRYTFEDENEWHPFYRYDKVKVREYHNISLGYEVKIY